MNDPFLYDKILTVSLSDIATMKSCNWSDKDILAFDAFKRKLELEKLFTKMVFEWYEGNKSPMSLEHADKLNREYRNTLMCYASDDNLCAYEPIVDFTAFYRNDYSIVLKMRFYANSEIRKWAIKNMKDGIKSDD